MSDACDLPPEIIEALRRAGHVVALTGAGISAESGIPTFRDAQTGLWAQYDPQDLASPAGWKRDAALVWRWYAWRRELCRKAEPNAGHRALVALEKHVPRFTLITQNVDGLHDRAGNVAPLELHGNIFRARTVDTDRPVSAWDDDDDDAGAVPPRDPDSGARLRPDVVWFGEPLPADILTAAFQAAQSADVFLSIGTSAVVYPAAQLPHTAAAAGALLIECNLEPTPLSAHACHVLRGPAGELLPALVAAAWPPA